MTVARNASYNLVASLVPMVVSFLTVPAYIAILGQTRYGVMAIFALLLGYFGVFDLGLSRAIAHRLALAGDANLPERQKIFWTGVSVNLAIGLVGSLMILPAAHWYFATQIKVPPTIRPEILSTAPWLALAVPIMLLTGVLRGALQGTGHFRSMNLISATGGVFTQLVTLAVAWQRPDLAIVLPVLFFTRILLLLALGLSVKVNVIRDWRPTFDRSRVADLFSFGGWVALSSLLSSLMTTIDRFIIGSAIGAQFVSYYSVPYQLGERSLVIPMALSDAIFPKIAQSSALGVRQIALRSLSLVSAIMLPIFCLAIVFLNLFLRFYISADFAAVASAPGRLLLAGFCINCFGLCCYVCLQAGGKPKLVAIAHLIEILPFMACLIVALREWGLLGAAVVFVARIAADALLLAFFSGVAAEFARISIMPVGILSMAVFGGELSTRFPVGGALLGSGAVIASLALGWQQLHAENLSPRALLSQLFPRWLSAGVSRR